MLLAIGSERPRELPVPGRELDGVHLAMDFLEAANRAKAGDGPTPLSAAGKDVVVLGGGDTGSDCLGTALRQGARSVLQLELMPMPPRERQVGNPWPSWPFVLRTSTSHQEGGARAWGWMTTRLEGDEGRLTCLVARPVDADLQPTGPEKAFPCQQLLLAMGFVSPVTDALVSELDVVLDERGRLRTDSAYRCSHPKLYAAGDARRGASLVVWVVHEGREAARAVDADLRTRRTANT